MYDKEINKRAVENLIRSGAFDGFGVRRSQLLAVMEGVLDGIGESRRQNVKGQVDLFGMGTENHGRRELHLPDLPEFSAREKMAMEKETTGLYLSGHPLDGCRELVRSKGAVPIRGILEDFAQEGGPRRFADNQSICVAGVVTSSKTKTTKNNSLMAYVTVEDDTAAMELLCFNRVLENCGNYLREGETILVKGKLSVRDEKAPQILCDSAYPLQIDGGAELSDMPREETAGKTVYLRIPSLESRAWEHIRLVLTMFEGSSPLKIRVCDSGKLLGSHCLAHPALLQELRETLGEENVVVKG